MPSRNLQKIVYNNSHWILFHAQCGDFSFMWSGFLPRFEAFWMGLVSSMFDAVNKNTAGSSNLLCGILKSLFDAKLHQAVRPRNLFFNLQRFLKIVVNGLSWCRNTYWTWFWAENTVNNYGNWVGVTAAGSHCSVSKVRIRDYCKNIVIAIDPVSRAAWDTIPCQVNLSRAWCVSR